MTDALELVRELTRLPGPPGQEEAVRAAVIAHAERLNCFHETDARGNLLLSLPGATRLPEKPEIVVMAHLDEIALMVVRVEGDGRLVVTNLGGLFPWKWGEGPVQILASPTPLDGVLSFGSIHTTDPSSTASAARERALTWADTHVFTGLSAEELARQGVAGGNPGRAAPVAPDLDRDRRVCSVAVSG